MHPAKALVTPRRLKSKDSASNRPVDLSTPYTSTQHSAQTSPCVSGREAKDKRHLRSLEYQTKIRICRDWKSAVALLEEMASSAPGADVYAFTNTIIFLSRAKQYDEALKLFGKLPSYKVTPNLVCINAIIRVCEMSGHWQRALDLMASLTKVGLVPDDSTYAGVIGACARGKQWKKALELLEGMEATGVKPTHFHFAAAILACEKGEQWEMAVELLSSMEGLGLRPSRYCFSASILSRMRQCRAVESST